MNVLDASDRVVQVRECFIKKLKELVENMGVRRKLYNSYRTCRGNANDSPTFWILKFDQVKEASSEKTAQEATSALKRIEQAIKESQVTLIEQVKALFSFAVITTAFLLLNFCTSVFYLLSMI